MPPFAYFVTLETKQTFGTDTYAKAAGELCNALHMTLGDISKLRSLTRTPNLADARVEVEIAQTEPEPQSRIAARAVIKASAADKMPFDKNMFSNMVRESLSFPVKITKQAVSQDELWKAGDPYDSADFVVETT